MTGQTLSPLAASIYEPIRDLPIVSPHGHCDPAWWAEDAAFPDPATLLIIPDHYVFRMLYAQGVPLEDLGIGVPADQRDPCAIFQRFADNWHLFLGTPSRMWMEYTLHSTLGVQTRLGPETAQTVYDEIAEKLASPEFRPRALFERFNIEVLATTDAATDDLANHDAIAQSGWKGRIVPTFRPDSVLNPARPDFIEKLWLLGEQTGQAVDGYTSYLEALRSRRAYFRARGATATDHDVPQLQTTLLPTSHATQLLEAALAGKITPRDALRFYNHMLVVMAEMSAEDGMVMQLHAGCHRDTNRALFDRFGADKGADIPGTTDWVSGLDGILNRVGNHPKFRLLVFTLDEASYARQLAPMAGHWPCLRLGPPWWFHDSINGIARYFDQVVETAGYYNLAGFNDDTRAFLSIPARHDTWRRAVAVHFAQQVEAGILRDEDAHGLAPLLARDLAVDAYRLGEG